VKDPFQVVRDFEAALCEYTGAPYAVAVNSCTMAILLAAAYFRERDGAFSLGKVSLPKLTYVGVPYALGEAGYEVEFRDEDWQGEHQISPLPIWDAARRFTGGMYQERLSTTDLGSIFQCVSFHHTKILGHSQGGAILHGHPDADKWLRRARFDGRAEGVPAAEDRFTLKRAWHAYLSPDVAAALLWKLQALPRHNADLPRSDYPDLSAHEAFK
jgi:dTDP-4-amino-4,6-dideoxygalactose transaminase